MNMASVRRGGSWKRCHAGFLAVILVVVGAAGAVADDGTTSKIESQGNLPIEITADRLLADSGSRMVTFEGNVKATQGEVTLYADRLYARYSGPEKTIDKITAEGNVRVIHAGKEGHADRAVFYNQEQKIVLSGNATLSQGEDSLAGDNVTIFLRENRSVVEGGDGGRVRAVIHPRGFLDRNRQNRDNR